LFDLIDEISFSEKLLELVNDKQLRLKLGNNGWDKVGNKFHYTRLVEDTRKLYYQLLNTKK
jgi:glycosyltransferase involved in cell wall biosynthesis